MVTFEQLHAVLVGDVQLLQVRDAEQQVLQVALHTTRTLHTQHTQADSTAEQLSRDVLNAAVIGAEAVSELTMMMMMMWRRKPRLQAAPPSSTRLRGAAPRAAPCRWSGH